MNDRIPRVVETICLKAMAKQPERRYETARQCADDLGRWLRAEPILDRPIGIAERSIRWGKRNPIVTFLSLAIVFALIVGATISTFFAIQSTVRAHVERFIQTIQ